jgi:hypothetical protein
VQALGYPSGVACRSRRQPEGANQGRWWRCVSGKGCDFGRDDRLASEVSSTSAGKPLSRKLAPVRSFATVLWLGSSTLPRAIAVVPKIVRPRVGHPVGQAVADRRRRRRRRISCHPRAEPSGSASISPATRACSSAPSSKTGGHPDTATRSEAHVPQTLTDLPTTEGATRCSVQHFSLDQASIPGSSPGRRDGPSNAPSPGRA